MLLYVRSTNLQILLIHIQRCIPSSDPFQFTVSTVLGPSAFLCNASAQDWQKDMRHLAASIAGAVYIVSMVRKNHVKLLDDWESPQYGELGNYSYYEYS